MAVEDFYKLQIDELKKMSYSFYLSLAKGKEPLTFTAKDDDNSEHQVEVNVTMDKDDEKALVVIIDFDTNWGGRETRTSGAHAFLLTTNNEWQEES
jgi:hypothetical protein